MKTPLTTDMDLLFRALLEASEPTKPVDQATPDDSQDFPDPEEAISRYEDRRG